ncbi:hypothetical protein JNK13_05390 [bacterium]|nr:hypothetical protein [bacterium]
MINLSNQEALKHLKDHKQFKAFLEALDFSKYPGLNIEQVFLWISTGTLVKGMNLNSTLLLLGEIKSWASAHSQGGYRKNAGAPKRNIEIRRITLSAERKDIERARAIATQKNTSLQAMFREWLKSN